MDYLIDFKKIKNGIKKNNAKKVLVQLPDGLKPDYQEFEEKLKGKDYDLFFWMGSCFGACDIPTYTKNLGIDLIVHLGHEEFIKED